MEAIDNPLLLSHFSSLLPFFSFSLSSLPCAFSSLLCSRRLWEGKGHGKRKGKGKGEKKGE